ARQIPKGSQLRTFNNPSHFNRNHLCGDPLPNKCPSKVNQLNNLKKVLAMKTMIMMRRQICYWFVGIDNTNERVLVKVEGEVAKLKKKISKRTMLLVVVLKLCFPLMYPQSAQSTPMPANVDYTIMPTSGATPVNILVSIPIASNDLPNVVSTQYDVPNIEQPVSTDPLPCCESHSLSGVPQSHPTNPTVTQVGFIMNKHSM
ncbi:hypothetical protein G4B88_019408, partial [Cannabis sativa]